MLYIRFFTHSFNIFAFFLTQQSQSELSNVGSSKSKVDKSKVLNSDRNPSPAPSTQSLHGGQVSLDTGKLCKLNWKELRFNYYSL